MQLHQTPNRSPRRVPASTSPRPLPAPFRRTVLACLPVLAFLFFLAGCGTAEDFSEDVAFIETETVDLETAAGTDSAPADVDDQQPAASDGDRSVSPDTSAADAGTADQQAERDSQQQTERPVLEVIPESAETTRTSDPADPDTDSAATADLSDPGINSTSDGTTASSSLSSAPAPAESSTSAPPATAAPTTATSNTSPPATVTSNTSPPDTSPPTTVAQTTPASEAPVTTPAIAAATAEPNCSVSCNIAMEGDSLTVGLGNRLCGAVKTGNCINSGIVGRRVDEMIVTARTDVDNQVGSGGNDVLILWGGTNDLWQKFHSTDPATNATAVYENIKTFVAERRASGWDYVYVMTLPPMNPTYVVGTEPLNDLIRQNTAGANGVLDVGADQRLANAFDPAMRAADGIHFGDGGRAVVMEYIFGTINNLDGR